MLSVFVYLQRIAVGANLFRSGKHSSENQVEKNENDISELLFKFYHLCTKFYNISGKLVS